MSEKTTPPRKLSDRNTKQEILDAYESAVKQLQAQRQAALNPEKMLDQKKTAEAVKVAEGLSPEGVELGIGNLKAEISEMLGEVAEKLALEAARFGNVQRAIEVKRSELQEFYAIEKEAATLAALIEAQHQKRREYEEELSDERSALVKEITLTRTEWDKEKKAHEQELKERDVAEKKVRERDREEYAYQLKREQLLLKDQTNDERARLEKEVLTKRESLTKELADRERAIAEKEKELNDLRARTSTYPKELDSAVNKAVKETIDRLTGEAKNRDELLRKDFEGQRNVLNTRIQSLEQTAKEQADQIARLSKQLEVAYQKVQDIAEKAIEGSAQTKAMADLQKLMVEPGRKSSPEKSG